MIDITQEWRKHEHCLRVMRHSGITQEPSEDKRAVSYWLLNSKMGSNVPQEQFSKLVVHIQQVLTVIYYEWTQDTQIYSPNVF